MKQFIIRITLFILIPIPFLYGLNYMVDKGLKRSNYIYYAEWNDLFNGKINADMLICGSSRAWKDISPAILDSTLSLNSYNLGMDGTHFSIQYDRVKMYLRYNKPPKYIIQTMDFTSFAESNSMDNQLQLMPYLDEPMVIELTAKYRDHYTLPERFFPLFKYNNLLPVITEGIKSYFGHGIAPCKYKGFQAQDKQWDYSFDKYIKRSPRPVNVHVAGYSVNRFYDYLQYCNKRGIKVIVVFPPVYHEFIHYCKNSEYILNILKKGTDRYGVSFLNYSGDTLGNTREYFYNSQHLNKKGAEAFSIKLANDLKKVIQLPSSIGGH